MDAFVSRKRRKLSPPPDVRSAEDINQLSVPDDDDSTDFKLAILASLHPYIEQQLLLDMLLAHNGSVDAASMSMTNDTGNNFTTKRSNASTGYQSSLSSFATTKTTMTTSKPVKSSKLLSKKGKTLHLFSPEDVAANTPCSIIHNFLPAAEANALLEEVLLEAPTFERMTFKLFDNVVSSPHTACFYVRNDEEEMKQKTEYIYNGGLLTVCLTTVSNSYELRNKQDVRQLTPLMRSISAQVETAVNNEVITRIKSHYPSAQKLKYQVPPGTWTPNAAFVNCYAGGSESVGYHSDQLTYLGPRAIIGSLSLGVAREFRVRRIIPQDTPFTVTPTTTSDPSSKPAPRTKSQDHSDAEGQIAIHLPHNSLLVMHAEMQEEWKHSIAPAAAIDPHPVAGNKRINITYRDYKPSLHPRFTPKCRCGVPTVLRVVQRKRENWGRYFWMCHAGNVPGKDGFVVLHF